MMVSEKIINDNNVKEECQETIENLKLISQRLEDDVKELEKSVLSMPSAQEMLQQAKRILNPEKENVAKIISPITPNRSRFAVPIFTPK